jgi:arginyl-tRNA synthetase
VISRDLRRALALAVAASGFGAADPGLRSTGTPGQYAASVALTLGANPRATATTLAATLAREEWIARVEVTGPGYLTITVTPEALAAVADQVAQAGPACVTSDALAGDTVPAPPPDDPLAAATWEKARTALAAQLTVRLAAAAGATVAGLAATERKRLTLPAHAVSPGSPVPAAVSFAGRDAVTFTLARAIPGKPLRIDQEIIARRVLSNPAYAVRYAHARAASGLRWAAASAGEMTSSPSIGGSGGASSREILLDALSWLPERVATAARRGRPDEFARYLEDLANVTLDVLSSASHQGSAGRDWAAVPGSDRLTLARAARTGLAAGLGLLGVSAPERLLTETYREPKL